MYVCSPGWDVRPLQGSSSISLTNTHLYTALRESSGLPKNTMKFPQPGLKPAQFGDRRTNCEDTAPTFLQ